MSNKFFIGLLSVMLVLSFGYITLKSKNREPQGERPGISQENHGQKHVAEGSKKYGGAIPPTSGDHASPVDWQAYDQEVPDLNIIHNLEHGGIVITYRPDLPADQVAKIKGLFFKPYSRKGFSPIKAVVAPRAANKTPIVVSSWTRYMELNSYDEQKMVDYYLQNYGKSPEPLAS